MALFWILVIVVNGSCNVFAFLLAGWASNSRYSLIGSLRSGAQVLSLEINIGILTLILILVTNTLSYSELIEYQVDLWFIAPLFPLYLISFITIIAETNRAPFDLPEAEAELVCG